MVADFRIVFNGDSNVAGTELASLDLGMAARLAKKLEATNTFNLASAGAGNDLIYDTTINFLNNNNNLFPQFMVIGWSEVSRIQWFVEDDWGKARLWEINHMEVGIPVPNEYKQRFAHWKEHTRTDSYWREVMTSYWHNKIYNLHKILEHRKIPHLFFNAFDAFKLPDGEPEFSWNNSFYSPYNESGTYVHYCQNKNYQEITPGWMHYPPEAHEDWAETLYQYMRKNQTYDHICQRG